MPLLRLLNGLLLRPLGLLLALQALLHLRRLDLQLLLVLLLLPALHLGELGHVPLALPLGHCGLAALRQLGLPCILLHAQPALLGLVVASLLPCAAELLRLLLRAAGLHGLLVQDLLHVLAVARVTLRLARADSPRTLLLQPLNSF